MSKIIFWKTIKLVWYDISVQIHPRQMYVWGK